MTSFLEDLASTLVLGSLLEALARRCGPYALLAHHTQGEFHHDLVLRIDRPTDALPGRYLVVATNCNGGVKEVLCFEAPPDVEALWHARCPDVSEFTGDLPAVLESVRTLHWFDPCELLRSDARSELRAEFRTRQKGGGWELDERACRKR